MESQARRVATRRLCRDQRGLSSFEYAVLFVVVSVGLLTVWSRLADGINTNVSAGGEKMSRTLGAHLTRDGQPGGANIGQALPGLSHSGVGTSTLGTSVSAATAAATTTVTAAAPAPPPPPAPAPAPTPVSTPQQDLANDIAANIKLSPALSQNYGLLTTLGWDIRYSTPPEVGSYTLGSTIVIDASFKGNPTMTTQLLAHELGHAAYNSAAAPPPVLMSGLTRQEFVEKNTLLALRTEAAAVLSNELIRDQIITNGGADIGVNGALGGPQYDAIYQNLKAGNITQDQAMTQVTLVWQNELTSTTGQTYKAYYGRMYEGQWDALYAGKPPEFRAP